MKTRSTKRQQNKSSENQPALAVSPPSSKKRKTPYEVASSSIPSNDQQSKKRRKMDTETAPTTVVTEPAPKIDEIHECGVCYEHIEEQGIIDSCSHNFCNNCIATWSADSNACPICRLRYTSIQKKNLASGEILSTTEIPQRDFSLHSNETTLIPVLWLLRNLIESADTDENEGGPLGVLLDRLFQMRFVLRVVRRVPTPRPGDAPEDPFVIPDNE